MATLAAPAPPIAWAIGANLDARLAAPVSLSWSNAPLASSLANLSQSERVAVLLDRRVDPTTPVRLVLSQEPLEKSFAQVAGSAGVGYSQLGPVAYFGPRPVAKVLRTLAALRLADARALPAGAGRRLLQSKKWRWDDLAEPRQLLAELASEGGVRIAGTEPLPHDLWRAVDLPALGWTDRMTLLLAQFGLTFHIVGPGRIELVPMPDEVALVRTYPAGRDAAALVERWAKTLPDARLSVDGDRVRLVGLLEDHQAFERRNRGGANNTRTTKGKQVYQLSLQGAPLGKTIEQLAQRLNVEMNLDRAAIDAAGISLDQLVSVKVENADLDELVRAVLKGTGLEFRRTEAVVSIFPAGRAPSE
jgi:hypothetical protein